jgi:hypothetical protein
VVFTTPTKTTTTKTTTKNIKITYFLVVIIHFTNQLPFSAYSTGIIIIFSGTAAQRKLWPPHPRGFFITQNDAPQSIGLLWTSDSISIQL